MFWLFRGNGGSGGIEAASSRLYSKPTTCLVLIGHSTQDHVAQNEAF